MVNVFRSVSLWMVTGVIAFHVGLALFIAGFSTNSWNVYPNNNNKQTNGLWRYYSCLHYCGARRYTIVNNYHRTVQTTECLGLICYTLALVGAVLYLTFGSFRRRDVLYGATVVTFIGVACATIGLAMFGSRWDEGNEIGQGGQMGWSMGAAIGGTLTYGLGGALFVVHLNR